MKLHVGQQQHQPHEQATLEAVLYKSSFYGCWMLTSMVTDERTATQIVLLELKDFQLFLALRVWWILDNNRKVFDRKGLMTSDWNGNKRISMTQYNRSKPDRWRLSDNEHLFNRMRPSEAQIYFTECLMSFMGLGWLHNNFRWINLRGCFILWPCW